MPNRSHIAILGRQPELGLIELESLLGPGAVEAFGGHALINQPLNLNRLGGSLKLGRIIMRLPRRPLEELAISSEHLPRPTNKLTFAASLYGLKATRRELEAFGLTLKKTLRKDGSVRLVLPKPGQLALTAAQLKFNHLPETGFELLIVADRRELIVALTEAVQDIDAYSARDHGRPARSAKVGMLPPKLAQILINTTQTAPVYDPFCGTGVILQEALLAGRTASGSDLTPAMVEASRTNLTWLQAAHPDLADWQVEAADAQTVQLPPAPLAIVSEGYLGPSLHQAPQGSDLPELIEPLLSLYRRSLGNWTKQLTPGSEVALCAPAWRLGDTWQSLPILDDITHLGYTRKDFETVPDQPLVYGRAGQNVGRALILLRKL